MENNKTYIDDDNNPLLIELLEKFYNIILYYELSSIDKNVNEEKKQIDIIIKCIILIVERISKLNNKIYENKVMNLTINIINISSKLHETFQTHQIKPFLNKYNNILNNKNIFTNNHKIMNQIEFVTNSITKYLSKLIDKQKKKKESKLSFIESKENDVIIINNRESINQDENINNETNYNSILNEKKDNKVFEDNINEINKSSSNNCCFCLYLQNFFRLNFEDIFNEIKYENFKKKFYRYIFLNFDECKTQLGINNYIWYLSQNESGDKIQNKFFIKENNIKIIGNKNQSNDLYKYEYNNNIEKYNRTIVNLQQIFIYDNISIDNHFINSLNNKANSVSSLISADNCLLIRNIQKTNSLFLIYKDYLLIIKNICIDNDNKLHVSFNEFKMNLWCINNEEYISELNDYIENNEKDIIKNYFDNKNDKKIDNQNSKQFGYNKNYNFRIKMLKYSEISEIHKMSYLQIPNSIEIITNNGKNYFLCFNIEKRDIIFMLLTNNILNLNSDKFKKKKKSSNIKKMNKLNSDDCFYMKYCPINYLDNSKDNNIYNYVDANEKFTLKNLIINDFLS